MDKRVLIVEPLSIPLYEGDHLKITVETARFIEIDQANTWVPTDVTVKLQSKGPFDLEVQPFTLKAKLKGSTSIYRVRWRDTRTDEVTVPGLSIPASGTNQRSFTLQTLATTTAGGSGTVQFQVLNLSYKLTTSVNGINGSPVDGPEVDS